ncbi:bifunctional tetrahydrofolate synthase/dihydrofolate synthase [Vitreoscilla stercoraria]|uniref:Dihydrofolate synthase/folylpolyglutamate synthase n=1 Tax=Vitreoscilla stercoraria TaxID=61 RepID=A0ABY4EBG7_VITST|nr:bifunctional tetrahydrofolate synthase/dihydrofolate synthase [Vitreoscilla stercoraria]UOO93091.1 bifunctional tetrahydrofolate synthase/dihydrofolate synthase [Vitreoscilla stercoraria]
MTAKNLQQWLTQLEQGMAGGVIDMGLTRTQTVKERMALTPKCPVVIVGGTNGKGSVCAFLTQIYAQAGFKVGTLTSPHLQHYNERIAINGVPSSDEDIVCSFERIQAACGSDVALTYFEYNVLAAVDVFDRANVDVMVLEVGMGGRLDAVNVFDADVSVVTSVDIDHQAFLGDNVEQIAFEKAGIFRTGRPAIVGQLPLPESMQQHADNIGTPLLLLQRDFGFTKQEQQQWSFRFAPQNDALHLTERNRHALPIPALRGAYQLGNAALALAVVECLNHHFPIDIGAIKRGLLLVQNPGRFQVLPGRPLVVWDVGHNPHAAKALRNGLMSLPYAQNRIAVFSMLADKDIQSVLDIVKDQFDEWLIAPLDLPRGMSAVALQDALAQADIHAVSVFTDVKNAYQKALSQATENDRIVVFGSFHTVAEVMDVPRY